MNEDFDYGSTGASDGSGGIWLALDAAKNQDPVFRIGRKDDPEQETFKNFTGRLLRVDLKWSDGNPEKNVSPGWEFVVVMNVKDEKRGVASEQTRGVPVAIYNVAVRCTHNTMMPSLLNVLAATTLDWSGYLSLGVYRKDAKAARLIVKTSPDQANGIFPPTRFPFDSTTNTLTGVPEPEKIFDAKGRPILDDTGRQKQNWTEPRNFWLNIAKEMYSKFNGVSYTGNIGPSPYDGYKTGEPWGTGTTQAPPTQQPQQAQQSSDAGTEALKAKSDQFYAALKTKIDAIQDPLLAKAAIEMLLKDINGKTKLADWGTNEVDVRIFLLEHYIAVTGDKGASWLPAGVIHPSISGGDLPF